MPGVPKFLKVVGKALAKGTKKFGPVIVKDVPWVGGLLAALIPGEQDDRIIAAVTNPIIKIAEEALRVELISSTLGDDALTNEQKRAIVMPHIRPLIENSLGIAGKKDAIADDARFNQGLDEILAGVLNCANAMKVPDGAGNVDKDNTD